MFYSQFGEDKILFEIFQRKAHGICVEVGANNGVDDSTSLFFEKIGWKCILVEPNPFLCQEIRSKRNALVYECAASNRRGTTTLYVVEGAPRSHGLSTLNTNKETHDRIKSLGFVSRPVQVNSMLLDDILKDTQINGVIDFISIDVEGHENEVLEGLSLIRWKPTIMVIENNSTLENIVTNNYLKKFGYARFLRTGVNYWYIHRTNKRFMNMRSYVRVKLAALKINTSITLTTSIIRMKIGLLKIPLILKIRNFLRPQGT